jgi:hypothetical protein
MKGVLEGSDQCVDMLCVRFGVAVTYRPSALFTGSQYSSLEELHVFAQRSARKLCSSINLLHRKTPKKITMKAWMKEKSKPSMPPKMTDPQKSSPEKKVWYLAVLPQISVLVLP